MSFPVHHPPYRTRRRMACMLVVAATIAALFISSVSYETAWAADAPTPAHQPGVTSDAPVFKIMNVAGQVAVCAETGTQKAVKPGDPQASPLFLNITDSNGQTGRHAVVVRTIIEPNRTLLGYCLDVRRAVDDGDPYCVDTSTPLANKLLYLFAYYPPDLTDVIEQGARQAAVWNLTGTGFLDTADPTDRDATVDQQVLARYNAILADVNANGATAPTPGDLSNWSLTIQPASPKIVWPTNPAQAFKVVLTQNGQPADNLKINLATSQYTLNAPSIVTDINGEGVFTLTADAKGTALITATVTWSAAQPLVFVSNVGSERQPVGTAVEQSLSATAEATWQDPTALDVISEPKGPSRLYLPAIIN